MVKKIVLISFVFFLICILVKAEAADPFSPIKIGDEAYSFTLPSSQGKLVDYYKDYYGKYHLVITFFPAAFTPI